MGLTMIARNNLQFVLISMVLIVSLVKGDGEQGLTSESVAEGPCDPNIKDYAVKNIQPSSAFRSETLYMPIASEGCLRSYAEVLLGRPAQTQEELDSMKLRIRITVPPIFLSYGFEDTHGRDKYFRQACLPTSITSVNQVLCLPAPSFGNGADTDTRGINTSLDTIVYTDNNGTALVVRCLNEKVKDYKVLAYTKTLSPETTAAIQQKIVEVGFNKDLVRINDKY